ncbi:YkgJ family cysteine cluster protein [bacterium (Candidatus Gribaldobacteria) CG08_land_8_20_14_0_20_39_15]|uniref:YkgJ family cysteine cluster protein n=1 Tax=bacterium (Candidatus Gribaldobacteria) CG08_land_8_20_14_0_20_39_15 TaxID=2014273 RepID=A0A2M6XU19_9BACT|nr:MAG: YkgJ family cysteine cluster protein [bacterium (Candidatus Gribaldobacteria) CG08_land_8_20_14_0_20_39_15]
MFRDLFCFHEKFHGDTNKTFLICAKCGACEHNQISALLPGEAEFITQKKGEPIESFRAKCLDGVRINGEIVDILKCSVPCVFLNSRDYSCEIKLFKPVMCLIYPLVFGPRDGVWRVDDSCPIAQYSEARSYFETEGRLLVEQLRIPNEWLRRTSLLDKYFNYDRMLAERECSIQKYKIYELDELLSFCKS